VTVRARDGVGPTAWGLHLAGTTASLAGNHDGHVTGENGGDTFTDVETLQRYLGSAAHADA